MFSWFKKRIGQKIPAELPVESSSAPVPKPTPAGNPGRGSKLTLSVTGPAGERTENIDLVQMLSEVFSKLGREHSYDGTKVTDRESGLVLQPAVASFQPTDDLSMQMCTTIEIAHPIHFPKPFFEFQHSVGDTGKLAVRSGFEAWTQLDLPVLLDALQSPPKTCTALEMQLPGGTNRRVLLGPVWLWAPQNPAPPPSEETGSSEPTGEESHPRICACCMFTNSAKAFYPLIDGGGIHAIRLYTMRNADGSAEADCRVNGEDFPEGQRALVDYVATWPPGGFEARKQYILIQDTPSG